MGREIRRVPPNWEHPKQVQWSDGRLQPMCDRTFEDAAAEWKGSYADWESGARPEFCTDEYSEMEFWEWHGGPPDRAYYRPWKDEEATWFQVWETVSEGTPVSPPFATPDELVNYLAAHGDFWDQKRGHGPWDRAAAESFVKAGWAPSLVVQAGTVFAPRDGMPAQ